MKPFQNSFSFCALFCFLIASQHSAAGEPVVLRNRIQLTLAGSQKAIQACLSKASEMDVQVNIAVVDDGGHLLSFVRMDGARPGSVYTSITKATSAATKRGATGPLPNSENLNTHLSLAVENAARASGGKFTTLKGGIPVIVDEQVIGAIGVGGATGEQDAEVAQAGIDAILALISSPKNNVQAITGSWKVEDIEGSGVIDTAATTIVFNEAGTFNGNTGINVFQSDGTAQKGAFTAGRIFMTKKAGPPALMNQESKFLKALEKATSYEISNKGFLILQSNSGETLIRAAKMDSSHK